MYNGINAITSTVLINSTSLMKSERKKLNNDIRRALKTLKETHSVIVGGLEEVTEDSLIFNVHLENIDGLDHFNIGFIEVEGGVAIDFQIKNKHNLATSISFLYKLMCYTDKLFALENIIAKEILTQEQLEKLVDLQEKRSNQVLKTPDAFSKNGEGKYILDIQSNIVDISFFYSPSLASWGLVELSFIVN